MRVKIQKWGNSLTLKIPKAIAFQSKIRQGEYVNMILMDNKIIVEPEEEKKYTLEELIAGVSKSNPHNEIDFGKREGNEYCR